MLQDIRQFKQDYRVLIQTVIGFAVLALLTIGVGGTIYRMIEPDGWLVQLFGGSFTAGSASPTSSSMSSPGQASCTSRRCWYTRTSKESPYNKKTQAASLSPGARRFPLPASLFFSPSPSRG
jgi:hypothetical protein